jgi:hypothetical protein
MAVRIGHTAALRRRMLISHEYVDVRQRSAAIVDDLACNPHHLCLGNAAGLELEKASSSLAAESRR